MTPRLIDRPGAQVPARVVVDKLVMLEILELAGLGCHFSDIEPERGNRIATIREHVESGAMVSLTVAEWWESGGGE